MPGSQTTLAQLGLPESFTPARLRISTRMFPAEKKGEWEPLKVRERKVTKTVTTNGANEKTEGDVTMVNANGEVPNAEPQTEQHEEEETLYEEDPTTEEGAVWPIQDGRIIDWSCFFALLTHVHNTLSPTLHTPVLVVTQPTWTSRDHEILTQFFFEKFKTPAFCIMDAALAACYAFATGTATVVDVGYTKCDVTAVNDFIITEDGRSTGMIGSGGDAMTQRLHDLLAPKGFTRDMCEQLKKSAICEILPAGTELPGENQTGTHVTNPAAAASTGASGSGSGQRDSIAAQGGAPRGPGIDTDVGDEDQDRQMKDGEAEDGVLDVASIVASGKTSEFLARKEKEKQEKAAAKKAAGQVAAAAKEARLPNSKRLKATFQYTERRSPEELNAHGKRAADPEAGTTGDAKRQKTPELTTPTSATAPSASDHFDSAALARKEERRRYKEAFIKREVEVGVERLQAASGGILDDIADAIHRAILCVPDYHKRAELWDSLLLLGNGTKVKGEQTTSVLWLPKSVLIMRIVRLSRSTARHSKQQIPHLTVINHHIHIRNTLNIYYTRSYRHKHSPPSNPKLRSPPIVRCKPPLTRRHNLPPRSPWPVPSQPTPSAASLSAAFATNTDYRAAEAWADANQYRGEENARIFSRMERIWD